MFDMFKICYYIYKDIEIELRSLNRRTYWNYENGVMIELGIKFYKKKLRLMYCIIKIILLFYRKEIGGLRWEYGGVGKLNSYRGVKDLNRENLE